MNVVVVIQARLGSSRLARKVLLDIAGRPMLQHVWERASRAEVGDVVIAIPKSDEAAFGGLALAKEARIVAVEAPENDVLTRYRQVAEYMAAEIVVRLTADCPLVDSDLIRLAVMSAKSHDYVSTAPAARTCWPDGMDVEVFDRHLLIACDAYAQSVYDREHVTPLMPVLAADPKWIYKPDEPCMSHRKWSVDTQQEYDWVCRVVRELGSECTFADIAAWLKRGKRGCCD